MRFFFVLLFSAISLLNAQSLQLGYQGSYFLDKKLYDLMQMRDERNSALSKKMAETLLLTGPSLGIALPIRRSPFRLEGGYSRKQKVFTALLPHLGGYLKDELLIRHNAIQAGLGFVKPKWGVGASLDFAETEWRTQSTFTSGGLALGEEVIKNKAVTLYAEAGIQVKSLRFRLRPYLQKSLDAVDFSQLNQQLGNSSTDAKSNLLNVGLQGAVVF